MPKTLRERARAFAKRTRTSTGQLIRASLAKYLDEDEDKDEVRRHVVKSVERVKKASPLRHPPESEIVLLIENEMVKLGSASSATSFASNETSEPEREYDDLVGAAIDPKRVRTRGDIIPEDADDE